MSILFYKVLHIFGIAMAVTALGGMILRAIDGGEGSRKLPGIFHGVALLLILVSGFGLLARLDLGFDAAWVWVKLAIWVLIGAMLALVRRMPQHAKAFWFALPVLVGFAAYIALYKPF